MPKEKLDQSPSEINSEILLLEAQERAYFCRLQHIYDASLNVNTSQLIELFLSKAANIDDLRREYLEIVKNLNSTRLMYDSKYEPNFQTLVSFDEIYSTIKYTLNKFSSSTSDVKVQSQSSTQIKIKPKIKLPPINLPQFNGDSKKWTIFYECYNSTIHFNSALSDSEKLHYLLGQLTGSALTSVAGIEPTGDNYSLIYSTLVDKYQDVRSLGCAYLDQIFNMKPLNSSKDLNSFIDIFTTSIAAFEKLEIPNQKDFIYLYIALKKVV